MKCVICGSENTFVYKYGDVNLTKCHECGIVFTDQSMIKEEVSEYYRNQYLMLDDDRLFADIRRFSNLPEQIFLLSEIMKYKAPPANLLDFGCDRGFFLEEARRIGYNIVGLELSESAIEYCRMNGLSVFNDIQQIQEKIDIVTMNHSLEHLTEPVKFINDLKQIMAKDALLSIRVPNFNGLWSKILKSKWIWFIPNNHYFHYTIQSLKYLLENNGFEIIFIRNRKPQNCITQKSNLLANRVYKRYFNKSQTLRNKLAVYYSWLTGSEVFALARIKSDH